MCQRWHRKPELGRGCEMNMNKRNIGGSILPSSNPQILEPIPFLGGSLQVRALPEADTHALYFTDGEAERELCRHPNGYSCHELAKRIFGGDSERIRDQARYIVACGGTCTDLTGFLP